MHWLARWTGIGAAGGWRPALALVAAGMIGSATTYWVVQPRDRADLALALSRAHVAALASERTVSVASSDRHAVRPWFAGRLDFSPRVGDLAHEGFNLLGARVDRIAGQPVAAVLYQRRKHVITLFVWPSDARVARPAGATVVRGFSVESWEEGDLTYAAISDLNARELGEFRSLFRESSEVGTR